MNPRRRRNNRKARRARPFREFLAGFGLTGADWDRMGDADRVEVCMAFVAAPLTSAKSAPAPEIVTAPDPVEGLKTGWYFGGQYIPIAGDA